jgi:hypothetical protein
VPGTASRACKRHHNSSTKEPSVVTAPPPCSCGPYGRSLDELTSPEASQLIELLKELRAGTKSVNDLLPGAAA